VKSQVQRHGGHCDLSLPSAAEAVEQAYLDLASAETQRQVFERYAVVQRAFGPGTDDGPGMDDELLAGAAVVRRGTCAEVRESTPVAGEGRACE